MAAAIRIRNATALTPRQEADETRLPADMTNWPFVFVHYPDGWEYSEKHGFLPSLSQIDSKPGVNGVEQDPRTLVVNNAKAIGGSIRKGGTIIDPRDRRLEQWQNYVVYYTCANGGRHYCLTGTEYELMPGGRARAIPHPEVYEDLRVFIRDRGMVAPMAETTYSALEEIEVRGLERLARRAEAGGDFAQRKLAAKEQRIQAMRKAWAAYREGATGEAVPATKTPVRVKAGGVAEVNVDPKAGA
jgi:hypothetical protein